MANRIDIKCVIVGDMGVGKRSLYTRYFRDTFYEDEMYISGDTYDSTVDTKVNNTEVSLQLLVMGSPEKSDKIRPLCYPRTNVFLLCFDITDRTSADNIESKWRPEVWHYCPDMPPIVLVGTKLDRREDALAQSQTVTSAEGEELAQKINAVKYIECSARSGQNVNDVFDTVARAHLQRPKRPKRGQRPTCLVS